jgi:nucleotide-binding universal stress UspA family protein
MRPFHKVLVATDFSPSADLAFEEALEIAAAMRLELRLVHIYSEIPPLNERPGRDHSNHTNRVLAERRLERLLLRAWRRGITVTPILKSGIPESEIVKVAENECADLLVMGAQGWSTSPLGEVAARVSASAPCPVLTVRVRRSVAMRKAC